MNFLFRTLILILVLLFTTGKARSQQQLPELLQRVLKTDTSYNSVSCKINIHVEVPGLKMPDKAIELNVEKGKEPKIKSKGMIILPKRGILGQYREFLDLNCQAILITELADTVVYKLVSLEKSTDWVTVDLKVTKTDARVHEMIISTRKNGEFKMNHRYKPGSSVFPETTVISFESMPVKFPLKFMGQQSSEQSLLNSDEPVNGKVWLRYSDVIAK
jgi:hypothetical protein